MNNFVTQKPIGFKVLGLNNLDYFYFYNVNKNSNHV